MANIKFALSVEPDNAELQARARAEAAKRERGVPTVPTTVGLERATNPFVRWDVEAIRVITKPHVNRHSSDENSPNTPPSLVFGKLRSMKDDFK